MVIKKSDTVNVVKVILKDRVTWAMELWKLGVGKR